MFGYYLVFDKGKIGKPKVIAEFLSPLNLLLSIYNGKQIKRDPKQNAFTHTVIR
jgi:hypothetical protein